MAGPSAHRDEAPSPRAVVFDFYGTLTVSASTAERAVAATAVARALGVDPQIYQARLRTSFTPRATGAWGDLRTTLRRLARDCGVEVSEEALTAGVARRREFERGFLRLRPAAVPVLAALRGQGWRIGVLSDCTHELPEEFPSLPLAGSIDAAVFSVCEGLRKPDLRLYARIAEALQVAPQRCWYLGDGGSNELSGARRAGMAAILLAAPDADGALVYDRERSWDGPRVDSLESFLAMVSPARG